MNDKLPKSIRLFSGMIATFVVLFGARLPAEEAKTDKTAYRNYSLEARVYSYLPDDVLATYRELSSGMVEPVGMLQLSIEDRERAFQVSIEPKMKEEKYLVAVAITSNPPDNETRPQQMEYDLSDAQPRSLEVARDNDGRVYRLSIVPQVVEHRKAAQFRAKDLKLENWSFPQSAVILNDREYLGQLGLTGGSLAYCDIPGLAKVEFSLLHLKDAQPLGTLQNGILEIRHADGTSLCINQVMNGQQQELLKGPYQVWVRWNKPTQSVDEYRQSLQEVLEKLKERKNNGDASVSAKDLERMEKLIHSDHIGMTTCGVRNARPDELEPSNE